MPQTCYLCHQDIRVLRDSRPYPPNKFAKKSIQECDTSRAHKTCIHSQKKKVQVEAVAKPSMHVWMSHMRDMYVDWLWVGHDFHRLFKNHVLCCRPLRRNLNSIL